jgi:hypothetical protein
VNRYYLFEITWCPLLQGSFEVSQAARNFSPFQERQCSKSLNIRTLYILVESPPECLILVLSPRSASSVSASKLPHIKLISGILTPRFPLGLAYYVNVTPVLFQYAARYKGYGPSYSEVCESISWSEDQLP